MLEENILKVWKDNRLDQEESITFQEVIKKFKKSENWADYIFTSMSLEEALSLFISSKDGLNCSYENEDFQKLLSFLKTEIKKQYKGEYENEL